MPIVRKIVSEFFENKPIMDHEANPSEIVAEGAAYMAFQQQNPDLANQIVVKQVDNESQPTQKNVPILFGYKGT